MGKAKGNSKALNYRCLVDLNILFNHEERSIRLGPGSVVGEPEYAEMIGKKLATADMFEAVAPEEADEESEM